MRSGLENFNDVTLCTAIGGAAIALAPITLTTLGTLINRMEHLFRSTIFSLVGKTEPPWKVPYQLAWRVSFFTFKVGSILAITAVIILLAGNLIYSNFVDVPNRKNQGSDAQD